MRLFEVKDATGRRIHISKERWKHIMKEHPEIAPIVEDFPETLTHPTIFKQVLYDSTIGYYYRRVKPFSRYLLILVKYLNGEGFVITAYFVRNTI